MSTENPAMGMDPSSDPSIAADGQALTAASPQLTRPLAPRRVPVTEAMQGYAPAQSPPARRTLDYLSSPARIMAVAIVLGWLVDLFFYGKAPGLSVPVFTLLLTGALFWLAAT